MDKKQIENMEKMDKWLHEEMEKTMFIMKGIESMDPLKVAFNFTHPAIRKFIAVAMGGKTELLDIISKVELNAEMEPKELFKSIHFMYEVFDAADEAYDVFLKVANDIKEN